MEIKAVCILGAGIMGSGIAQVVATAGFTVTMRDIEDDLVNNGLQYWVASMERLTLGKQLLKLTW